MAATLYTLETWFVSGIYVRIPCKEEMMMMMMMMTKKSGKNFTMF
jgi:hypothetical protein